MNVINNLISRNNEKAPSQKPNKSPTAIPQPVFDAKNQTQNNTSFINAIITKNETELKINTTQYNMTVTQKSPSSTSLLIAKIVEGLKNLVTTEGAVKKQDSALPLCDVSPPDLGEHLNLSTKNVDFIPILKKKIRL